MGIVRAALEKRAVEWGPSTAPPTNGSLGMGNPTGGRVSEATALQVTAVYGSVGVIADSLATLPWDRWSSLEPATRRKLPPTQLMKQPYVEIRRTDWLTQYATSMALRGNFYGHVVDRDEDFYPTQIKPIHPDHAEVRRAPAGASNAGAPEYRFNGKLVKIDDVFHIRNLSLAGSLVGLNPIEYLRVALALALAQEGYGAAYFRNSANPGGVIEAEDDLDDEEVGVLARSWMQAHQGVGQSHLPAVLTAGAKFHAIQITPQDSQFLESRAYSGSDISGKIFRVPPHMIGIVDRSTSWGTGIEQQEMGYARNTLAGYYGRLEEGVTSLSPDEDYTRFDLSERLRGDKLQRYQAHSLGVLGGWLCADDVRDEEGKAPVPDGMGANYMVPINSELLKQALKELQAPVTPVTPPPEAAPAT
jgi:HK97 family phage portal protein